MESLIESLIDGSLLNELWKIFSSWENATVADTPQPSVPSRKSEPWHRQVLRIQICQIWYPAIPMTRREDVLTAHAVSLSLFLPVCHSMSHSVLLSACLSPLAKTACSSVRLQVSPGVSKDRRAKTAGNSGDSGHTPTANDSSSQSANHPASPLSITPAKMNSRLTAN